MDFVDTEPTGDFSDDDLSEFFEVRVDLADAWGSVVLLVGSGVSDFDGAVTARAMSDPLTSPVDHEISGGPGLAGVSGLTGISPLAGGAGATGCAGAGWRGGGMGVTWRTGGLCGVTGFCRGTVTRRGTTACGAGATSAGVRWVVASPGAGAAGGAATTGGAGATWGARSAWGTGEAGAGCAAGAAGALAGAGTVTGELVTMSASAGTLAPGVAGAVPRRTCPGTVRRSRCWRMTRAVKAPTTTTAMASRITNSFVERVHRRFIQVPPGSTPMKSKIPTMTKLLENTAKVRSNQLKPNHEPATQMGSTAAVWCVNPSQ